MQSARVFMDGHQLKYLIFRRPMGRQSPLGTVRQSPFEALLASYQSSTV